MKRRTLRRRILSQYDSLGQFAKVVGMEPTTLSSHLRGDRQMRTQTILKFASALGITQDEIGKYFFPELEETDGIQEDDKETD